MNNHIATATAFVEDPLREEELKKQLERQDTCHHNFIYRKVGYMEKEDKEIETCFCKKCGFNWL